MEEERTLAPMVDRIEVYDSVGVFSSFTASLLSVVKVISLADVFFLSLSKSIEVKNWVVDTRFVLFTLYLHLSAIQLKSSTGPIKLSILSIDAS